MIFLIGDKRSFVIYRYRNIGTETYVEILKKWFYLKVIQEIKGNVDEKRYFNNYREG